MSSRAGFSFVLAMAALVLVAPLSSTGITTATGACLDYSAYQHLVASLPVEANYLDQAGDYVYLSSLQVVDVSVPGAPIIAGSFPGRAGKVRGITATAANLFVLYSAADGTGFNGMAIYDRSNPTAPALLASIAMPQFMTQMRVVGNRAYLRNDQGRLLAVDVSDPALPVARGSIGQGWLDSFDLRGNLLYAVDSIRNDVAVIDVSDISSLQVDYRLNLPDIISISFHGEYGYFLDRLQGTHILSFTAPDQYAIIDEVPTLRRPLVVRGDLGYAYGTELGVYQLASPAPPTLWLTVPFNVRGGLLDGNRGLFGISNTFAEVDLGNLLDLPGIVTRVDLPATLTNLIPAGDHLITMSRVGFETYDATDCAAPVFLAGLPWSDQVLGQALAGNYFYVLLAQGPGSAVLKVFDVTDMSTPSEVASRTLNGFLSGLTAVGDFLYTSEFGSLIVLNVADPLNPSQFSRTDNVGYFPLNAADGGSMVVVDGTLLRHFDVSSPDNPVPTTTIDTGVEGRYVLLSGGVAAVAYRTGVKLFGVTTSGAKNLLSDISVPGTVDGIAFADGTLYVEGSGIFMLDISDPVLPVFVGNLGYAADRAAHLSVLNACVVFDQYVSRDRGRLNFYDSHCAQPVPLEPSLAIDIKPGSDTNPINCRNEHGVIPVAILTTPEFDALTIDHTTVRFGPGEARETHFKRRGRGRSDREPVMKRHEEDVDGDGDLDLVFHFDADEADISCGDTEVELSGETYDGLAFVGSDMVRTVYWGRDHDDDDDDDGHGHGPDKVTAAAPTLALSPNPFNPMTTIAFSLPSSERVRIEVYDLTGRRISVVAHEEFGAGAHQVVWRGTDDNGRPAASGVYFVRLAGDTVNLQQRAVLLK